MAWGARMVNAVVLVFTLIAGLVVFLRLFTRGVLLRKVGSEDAWITLAMVLSIGLTVAIALQIQNGMGKHIYELTPEQKINSLKAFWASVWIYNLALTATKVSILLQYLRIFPTPRFRTVCFFVLGIVSIYGAWTLFGSFFLCFPVTFFWDKTIVGGKCLNQFAVWFTNAGVNIAQDVVILFLPMTVLRNLDIPTRQKKALIIVFALGGVVCLVSIIRLQSLVAISNSSDPTFDNPPAAMSSAIETNVGIICTCLPSMRPLLSAMMPAYFPDSARNTNVLTRDEEQPKHMRYPSASSGPYTTGSTSRTSHSRTGCNSPPYISDPTSRSGHSRTASDSSRSYSRDESELEVMQSHQAKLLSTRRGIKAPVRQLTLTPAHPRHDFHPLRMSPFSPIIPRLPRLPENVATVGPIEPQMPQYFVPPRLWRTPRAPAFHKPLPITPFPIMPGSSDHDYSTHISSWKNPSF